MISIASLWLPILAAAVFVFVVSSLVHMVLKYHASDFRGLPNEEAAMDVLRGADLAPGQYHMPHCADFKEVGTPEMQEKFKRGPVGILTIFPSGPPTMGKALVQWFLYTLLVGVFVAYLAGRFLPVGAEYLTVFRFAGTAAFMAYCLGPTVDSIWRGVPWSTTAKNLLDGLLYSLVTAGAFGWLWP